MRMNVIYFHRGACRRCLDFISASFLLPLLTVLPMGLAVEPPSDGGYPTQDMAENGDTLFSNTTSSDAAPGELDLEKRREAQHPRINHTATLLNDGTVLVAGGANFGELASAELYDPASETWAATSSLRFARHLHTATLLESGRLLIAGGGGASTTLVKRAELGGSQR